MVLHYLSLCGKYTGLSLNLSKTIAFDPFGCVDNSLGIQVTNKPVKYLGTYLSMDPTVEQLNFEVIKSKMKSKINHWKNKVVSLQGCILVIKVLIFSYCTHILNTTYIASKHLDQIQHMLNEFLWHDNKVSQQIFCQDFAAGGLRMLCVWDSVLKLRIKWFRHLWNDKGQSWSAFVWPQVLSVIPGPLMPGMSFVSDAWIQNLDPFYQDII